MYVLQTRINIIPIHQILKKKMVFSPNSSTWYKQTYYYKWFQLLPTRLNFDPRMNSTSQVNFCSNSILKIAYNELTTVGYYFIFETELSLHQHFTNKYRAVHF